jgi:hypothetical protein
VAKIDFANCIYLDEESCQQKEKLEFEIPNKFPKSESRCPEMDGNY